jgi:arylsulfatase
MENDRSELKDLSGQYPDRVKEMSKLWKDWADKVQVFPAPWKEKKSPVREDYISG